ncbi:GGDEF domain-containing response regulator [Roseospira visakhapatnamensis]|uniref:diguanylate cyclase n=1 Tax=Roseospira visakhapatnamensis TaxID=390880 RepID=A0A7W6RCG0_9PROT|nr:diguanylate cyclase [Roseospira visakhapatnamensis]MBB4265959.1 diguanylate cyclase (GGDEF)-like protein/PAS domain S-box-containing protein [Roseospira visakhapatnamensis]
MPDQRASPHSDTATTMTAPRPEQTCADDARAEVLRVLVVDNDPAARTVARRVLEDLARGGRTVDLRLAPAIEDARTLLSGDSEVAVVLIDMALDAEAGGLGLARWLRETQGNRETRLMLRVPHPDRAPDPDTVVHLDISDCRCAPEGRDTGLHTSLVATLRSFETIRALARHRDRLAAWTHTLEHRVAERTRALRDSERRLRSILDAPMLPIVILSMAEGRVLFANDSANQGLGLFATRHDDAIWCDPEDRDRLFERLRLHGRAGDFEAQIKTHAGHRSWALVSAITMTFDDTPSALLSFSDISGRKAMEEDLKRLATTDPLTGIGNRRTLMDQGDRELRRARRYAGALSMLILDIDHFKRINDGHGHAVGDRALKAVVAVCLHQLREIDILCRYGGEEFVALLPETPFESADRVAERLREAIARIAVPVVEGQPDGAVISFTVSIGVAAPRPDDTTLGDVLERADAALYAAKQAGRDRVMGKA